ncbi:MAG: beta-lactamase family protein [Candidatus Latescibacteria bacterium]|jgi:CubicO group peptidase (beta-lactamase class C family)|nr:beta-lactamase family protein [Candidatus Latescibacterota bacterium]
MIEIVEQAEAIGLSEEQLLKASLLLQDAVANGQLMGAVMQVARHGKALSVVSVGRREIDNADVLVAQDTVFLIASITKPIVCAAVMKLIEDGRLCLNDKAADYLPAFGNRQKECITLHHLLTHTSGLPDMLPDNQALRQAHQPLSVFVEKMNALDVLFELGTKISYQSCGIAILSAIVERVEGCSMPEILRTHFFDPLRMTDSSLGKLDRCAGRISEIMIPGGSDGGTAGTDWDWNSEFWHGFAAPWGGMFTTAEDLTTLCQMFLNGGRWNNVRVLGEATVATMTRDQTCEMPNLPDGEKLRQRWGLGWRLQDANLYGDLVSARTFGHGGATGTVAWMDPESGLSFVLLTNQADAATVLRPRLSNVIASAVM